MTPVTPGPRDREVGAGLRDRVGHRPGPDARAAPCGDRDLSRLASGDPHRGHRAGRGQPLRADHGSARRRDQVVVTEQPRSGTAAGRPGLGGPLGRHDHHAVGARAGPSRQSPFRLLLHPGDHPRTLAAGRLARAREADRLRPGEHAAREIVLAESRSMPPGRDTQRGHATRPGASDGHPSLAVPAPRANPRTPRGDRPGGSAEPPHRPILRPTVRLQTKHPGVEPVQLANTARDGARIPSSRPPPSSTASGLLAPRSACQPSRRFRISARRAKSFSRFLPWSYRAPSNASRPERPPGGMLVMRVGLSL